MKKQTLLLSALALSIGYRCRSASGSGILTDQVPGQGAPPSLAPMLERFCRRLAYR